MTWRDPLGPGAAKCWAGGGKRERFGGAGKTKPIEDHYERLEAQMKQFLARCFEKVQFFMVIVAWNASE